MEELRNFSCFDSSLSHENVTQAAWMIIEDDRQVGHSILAYAVIQILLVAIGLPWNIAVIVTVVSKSWYKQPTYILLLNLVCADLLSLCTFFFSISSNFTGDFSLGNSDYARCNICHGVVIVKTASILASYFTLSLMALDRLVYIKWPLHYAQYIKSFKTVIVISIIWAVCILFSALPAVGVGEIKFRYYTSDCTTTVVGENTFGYNVYYAVILSCVAAIPFITSLVANIWTLVIIRRNYGMKHSKSVQLNLNDIHKNTSERNTIFMKLKSVYRNQQLHLAQVFGILFAVNIVTWVPIIVIVLIRLLTTVIGIDFPNDFLLVVIIFFISQAIILPIVETFVTVKVRRLIFINLCRMCINRVQARRSSTNKSV